MNDSDAATVCRRFSVSGRVQGVFFRDSTRIEAQARGISGYAHNLADGTVEVVACGDAAAVSELAHWLRSGPPMASVSTVKELAADDCSFSRFSVG